MQAILQETMLHMSGKRSNPTTLASSCNLLNISSIFKYPEQYNIKTFSHEKEGKKKII